MTASTLIDGSDMVDNQAGGALLYDAFAVSHPNPLILHTPSGSNAIYSDFGPQINEGQPAFYIAGNVLSFTLSSLDFVVALNTNNGLLTGVQPGTIQFSGRRLDGSTVTAELDYTVPAGTTPAPFTTFTLPSSFTNLYRVDIQLVRARVNAGWAWSSIFFDNVVYEANLSG